MATQKRPVKDPEVAAKPRPVRDRDAFLDEISRRYEHTLRRLGR